MSITSDGRTVSLSSDDVFVRETGDPGLPSVLFLHGWPEDGSAWNRVVQLASAEFHCVRIDLPGIGRSTSRSTDADPVHIAHVVRELVGAMELTDLTLVGHDYGGMVTFSYLLEFDDLRAAVIMDTVVPGVAPWEEVLANPYVWHFGFHSIPELPEKLVAKNVRAYFDYFFDAISAKVDAITEEAREGYAKSYSTPTTLTRGFEFYRSLPAAARRNAAGSNPIETPTLYLRGENSGGDLDEYEVGLRGAGLINLTTGIVAKSGHFSPEENPGSTWTQIKRHIDATTTPAV